MGVKSLGLSLLSMLAFAAFIPAQGQIGLPAGPMTAGKPATVSYSNPDRAGESVAVKVDNGEGEVQVIEIQLDANGHGSEEWQVPPGWFVASFAAGDAHETRMVDAGADPAQ